MFMTAKEKKLHKQIVSVLKDKNLYEPSDEILIDELIFLQSIIASSKADITAHGILVNVRADGSPLYQVNQAVSVYRDSLKSLVTICTKLGITPQERSKLKLIEKRSDFDLNGFLNNN
jgi:P27 family predicted phage terminase small subunit